VPLSLSLESLFVKAPGRHGSFLGLGAAWMLPMVGSGRIGRVGV
jgi:hypothetical protein